MSVMDYVFICTNYNNSHFTKTAVETLLGGEHPPVLIVVVDNDSMPEQQSRLRADVEGIAGVELIFSPKNVGYFAGLNIGLRRACELQPGADAYIVGNNDLEFPSDFGTLLANRADTIAQRMVAAPSIVTIDGTRQNPHAIRPVSRLRELAFDGYASSYHIARLLTWVARHTSRFSRRRDVDNASFEGFIYMGLGALYILSPRFIQEIGQLPETSFLLHEEFFLAKRLAEADEAVYFVPEILVWHHEHGSVKLVSSRRMWSYWRESHRLYRRDVKLFRRNPILDVLDKLQHRQETN